MDFTDEPPELPLVHGAVKALRPVDLRTGHADTRGIRMAATIEREDLINEEHLDEMCRIYWENVVIDPRTGVHMRGADMAAESRRLLDKRVEELNRGFVECKTR